MQPDLFVVLAGFEEPSAGPVDARPDLVVEVTSENRAYDRMTKRLAYAEAGIPEYWIIDRQERRIELVHGLETTALVSTGEASASVLEGFIVAVSALFPV